MNDAEAEVQRQRILELNAKWLRPLGLLWWHIDFIWHREPLPDGPLNLRPAISCNVQNRVSMQVTSQWEYLTATLEVDLRIIEEMDDETLEQRYLHELCHILLAGLACMEADENHDGYRRLEEYTATTLANAFQWVSTMLARVVEPEPDVYEQIARFLPTPRNSRHVRDQELALIDGA